MTEESQPPIDPMQRVPIPCPHCSGYGILVIAYPRDNENPWRFWVCRHCRGRGVDPQESKAPLTITRVAKWHKARSLEEIEFIKLEVQYLAPSNPDIEIDRPGRILLRKLRRRELSYQIHEMMETRYGQRIEMDSREKGSVEEGVHEELQRKLPKEESQQRQDQP